MGIFYIYYSIIKVNTYERLCIYRQKTGKNINLTPVKKSVDKGFSLEYNRFIQKYGGAL